MMDNSIQIPLDLPDVRVLEVSKTEEGSWLIRVESTLNSTSCRKCGRELTRFHGFDQPIRLRHLPVFEQPVDIELKPKRYQCHYCKDKPTTTQRLSWHELRKRRARGVDRNICKLSGKLNDLWSFSLGYDQRVIFYFTDGENAVFIDIGNHDEVY